MLTPVQLDVALEYSVTTRSLSTQIRSFVPVRFMSAHQAVALPLTTRVPPEIALAAIEGVLGSLANPEQVSFSA